MSSIDRTPIQNLRIESAAEQATFGANDVNALIGRLQDITRQIYEAVAAGERDSICADCVAHEIDRAIDTFLSGEDPYEP